MLKMHIMRPILLMILAGQTSGPGIKGININPDNEDHDGRSRKTQMIVTSEAYAEPEAPLKHTDLLIGDGCAVPLLAVLLQSVDQRESLEEQVVRKMLEVRPELLNENKLIKLITDDEGTRPERLTSYIKCPLAELTWFREELLAGFAVGLDVNKEKWQNTKTRATVAKARLKKLKDVTDDRRKLTTLEQRMVLNNSGERDTGLASQYLTDNDETVSELSALKVAALKRIIKLNNDITKVAYEAIKKAAWNLQALKALIRAQMKEQEGIRSAMISFVESKVDPVGLSNLLTMLNAKLQKTRLNVVEIITRDTEEAQQITKKVESIKNAARTIRMMEVIQWFATHKIRLITRADRAEAMIRRKENAIEVWVAMINPVGIKRAIEFLQKWQQTTGEYDTKTAGTNSHDVKRQVELIQDTFRELGLYEGEDERMDWPMQTHLYFKGPDQLLEAIHIVAMN